MAVGLGRQACQLGREVLHAFHPSTRPSQLCTLKPSQALIAWRLSGLPDRVARSATACWVMLRFAMSTSPYWKSRHRSVTGSKVGNFMDRERQLLFFTLPPVSSQPLSDLLLTLREITLQLMRGIYSCSLLHGRLEASCIIKNKTHLLLFSK